MFFKSFDALGTSRIELSGMPLVSPLLHLGTYVLMKYTKQRRFDEVLYELEQERQCVDEDLRRLTAAAAYLRTLLPHKRLISAFVLVVHGSVALPGTDNLRHLGTVARR
jgi:hypothetical protein